MASLAHVSASTLATGSRSSLRSAFTVRSAAYQESKQACQKPDTWLLQPNPDLQTESTQHLGRAALTAAVAAALMFTDPAIAFKGGGPYGQEVTRGLDLSGKDFSGKTLIKQDFKADYEGVLEPRPVLTLLQNNDSQTCGKQTLKVQNCWVRHSLMLILQANFTNANLEGALVTGNTSFKGAIVTGADFTDVLFRDDQRSYLCSIADGVNPVTGNATRDTLGC